MLKEFKKFALRGNVIDLAIGVIIGASFNTVVQSLVNDIFMPPIGLLLGRLTFSEYMFVIKPGVDNPGPYMTVTEAKDAGAVAIGYGQFVTVLISFIVTAFAVFLLVRAINRLYVARTAETPKAEPVFKECPYCVKEISIKAVRCPFCTSDLPVQPTAPAN